MHFKEINKEDFKKTNIISRRYNTIWKKYAGRKCIGDCSNLFQRLRPKDYYDFYLKYTKDGEETVEKRNEFLYYGRTETEIEELAKKYMEECNDPSYTLSDYVKNIYMHTIIETFDGQNKENEVNQILSNLGFTYEKPVKNEDSYLGIDFKVFKDNQLSFVLQIKPISFFRGINNLSLIEDRKNAFEKERNTLQKLNVPTYYMVYKTHNNGVVSWLSEHNKLCFKLSSLCNENTGFPKRNFGEFIFYSNTSISCNT